MPKMSLEKMGYNERDFPDGCWNCSKIWFDNVCDMATRYVKASGICRYYHKAHKEEVMSSAKDGTHLPLINVQVEMPRVEPPKKEAVYIKLDTKVFLMKVAKAQRILEELIEGLE